MIPIKSNMKYDRRLTKKTDMKRLVMSKKIMMVILTCISLLLCFAGCGSGTGAAENTEADNDQQSSEQTLMEEAEEAGEDQTADTEQLAVAAAAIRSEQKGVSQQLMFIDESDGYANVRKGPGTDYGIAGTLRNDTIVAVVGPYGDWYLITSGSYAGYYLHKSTVSDNWDNLANVRRMFVSSDDGEANIRAGRGTNYDIMGKLYNGTVVYVSHLEKGWYLIEYGEYTGFYIHKDMLSKTQPDVAKVEVRYVSQPDGYANIRKGRGTKYDVVGRVPNGTALEVTSLKNGWYKIASGSYKGYYISQSTLVK